MSVFPVAKPRLFVNSKIAVSAAPSKDKSDSTQSCLPGSGGFRVSNAAAITSGPPTAANAFSADFNVFLAAMFLVLEERGGQKRGQFSLVKLG